MSRTEPDILTVALPKGRMSIESLALLKAAGLTQLSDFPKNRKLIHVDAKHKLEFLLIRSKDVGTYVEKGAADLGIIGFDLLSEHNFNVYAPLDLGIGACRLSVAYPNENPNWQKRRNLTVATKYPNLAEKYFYEQGININIIMLYGSIEIAPVTQISDIIVDLVSTGQTLKENFLTEGNHILESSARLIVNPESLLYKRKRINHLIEALAENLN